MDYSGKIIRKNPVTPSQTSASGVWTVDEALQAQRTNTWPVANVPDPISRSLRFRSSASAYLNRTPTASGSATIFTYSAWVKRGSLTNASDQWLFGSTNYLTTGSGNPLTFEIIFKGTDSGGDVNKIVVGAENNASSPLVLSTTQVFRDPSAWYHIVVAIDTTQATASNRAKLYVNGVQVTAFGTATYLAQNTALGINQSGNTPTIGCMNLNGSPTRFFDGYMTEVYLIDGQALTPSSFGGTNAVTGVWEPRPYTGTYGTNGFLLTFSDITSTATLGNDTSGNSNNWTTNNISLTAGSTYDSMLDVPTQWIGYNTGDVASVTRGNYPTLNPLKNYQNPSNTLSAANLNFQAPPSNGQFGQTQCTMALPPIGSTGKYYYEVTWSAVLASDYNQGMGIMSVDSTSDYAGLDLSTNTRKNRSGTTTALGVTISAGDTIQIAVDCATSSIWFGRNNTWYEGNPSAGTGASFTNLTSGVQYTGYVGTYRSGANNVQGDINFGQRPFSYTPPAGFLSLCTTNLPSPTILQGNQYMDATLYTGNGTTQTITNSGSMSPDFIWLKKRNASGNNGLYNSVTGVGNFLVSNLTDAENSGGGVSSFNSNGWSFGNNFFNDNGDTFVGWQWRASDSAPVTNTAGSITSTVSANTTAGFSIVTYTGTGANATVGHGLGVAPSMIFVKTRNISQNWIVYNSTLGKSQLLYLNSTEAALSNTDYWGTGGVTSTVFGLKGGGFSHNLASEPYVAYCFAAVAGYSAFGSYTGNSSTDGTFIYTGFRPAYVLIKRSSASGQWSVRDDVRLGFNASNSALEANTTAAETTSTAYTTDLLSNGFKLRTADDAVNISGSTYIYMAFAENPFKNALAR